MRGPKVAARNEFCPARPETGEREKVEEKAEENNKKNIWPETEPAGERQAP